MPRKTHQVVWHKKKSKFVSASCLKAKNSPLSPQETADKAAQEKRADKFRAFSEQLSSAIKKAVRTTHSRDGS